MNRGVAFLTLFASSGTLICCALPSLLVALGLGATMAGLVSAVPGLVWISQYKGYVFAGSALMILLAWGMWWRSRNEPCPVDPQLAKACTSARTWSLSILVVSTILWNLGAFFAFLAPLFVF